MTANRTWWLGGLLLAGLLAGLVAGLSGCSALDSSREHMAGLHAQGRYDQIAADLDSDDTREDYGSKNAVLWALERGAAALALDDYETAIATLEDAERRIELKREESADDVFAQWAVNDRAVPYIPEPYEDHYVNVLKLLAQLEKGVISGGASVEARRLGAKADLLRDEYLSYREHADSDFNQSGLDDSISQGLVEANDEGRFVESPLGVYLSAVTFMKNGDSEFQRVAGRRLIQSIELQEGLIGNVNADNFRDLEDMSSDAANVLVVGLSGRGPTRYAEVNGPMLIGTVPVYFELPRLRTHPSEVSGVVIQVQQGESKNLALIEDLSSVATANHERVLPLIHTRSVIRYAIRAGISVAITEVAREAADDSDQELVQVLGALAGLLTLAVTERADLRCWTMLPGQAHVTLLKLPPGEHTIRLSYQSWAGAQMYQTPWRQIKVTPNGLTTIVEHYWR